MIKNQADLRNWYLEVWDFFFAALDLVDLNVVSSGTAGP